MFFAVPTQRRPYFSAISQSPNIPRLFVVDVSFDADSPAGREHRETQPNNSSESDRLDFRSTLAPVTPKTKSPPQLGTGFLIE